MKVLLAVFVLLLSSCSGAPREVEGWYYKRPDLWTVACKYSQYDCTGVLEPLVIESTAVEYLNAFGVYVGGPVVFVNYYINEWAMEHLKDEIIIHEMVHYLQSVHSDNVYKAHYDSNSELCADEKEAYTVTLEWLKDTEQPTSSNEQQLSALDTFCESINEHSSTNFRYNY